MQDFFLARQPILDRNSRTHAYELLFRSSHTNAYDPTVDGDSATSQVLINSVTESGIDRIVGDKHAFINLTNRFLENPGLLEFLPPDRVVLEVLETVEVNVAVIAGVKRLKKAGYNIALDDFVMSRDLNPLVAIADIIKYDITQYEPDALIEIAQKRTGASPKILAERVETLDEFTALSDAGFDYFQGYYFAKPNIISGTRIPTNKIALLQLLSKLNDPNITIDQIAEIMSREVSLGVRALKFVNSPMSGLKTEVTSIKHAAVLLGREMIRNWVTLLIMAGMDDKPLELIGLALTRGRFCQLCAHDENIADDGAYFTVGLLSLLDAIMDIEMSQVLDNIAATQELRDALVNNQGRASELLQIVRLLERNQSSYDIVQKPLSDAVVNNYIEAIVWAEDIAKIVVT